MRESASLKTFPPPLTSSRDFTRICCVANSFDLPPADTRWHQQRLAVLPFLLAARGDASSNFSGLLYGGLCGAARRLNRFDGLNLFRFKLRTGDQSGESDRIGVLQVRIDGCHHDTGFNGDEVDSDQ